MANPIVENIVKTKAGALANSGHVAETIMKGNAEALTESGNASKAAVQELTKAYQELECQEPDRCDAGAGRSKKSPTEFIELQQRLIKEELKPLSAIAGT